MRKIATALIAVLVSTSIASCAAWQKDVSTGGSAFAACGKADLAQVVDTSGATLLEDVAAIIIGNGAGLEADLTALAAKVGLDAVQCAIAAVQAVMAPPKATPASSELPDGLSRALIWSASHK